jgi:high affinity sulfate transporter 1
LRADVVAGLTVAALLVPQTMAYARLAGLPPAAGFRAALPALLAYALVGSSRHLQVGPEPGTALLAAAAIAPLAAGDPDRYADLMMLLAVLVGLVALVGAGARLGALATLLSRPVLVGYLCGVGVTLLASQIAPFTGLSIEADHPVPRLIEAAGELGDLHGPTVVLGAATLAVILVLRWRFPRAPGVLVAVAGATAVAAVLSLDGHGVAMVGEIPAALPTLSVPRPSPGDLGALAPAALGIALVGYADNMLTARAVADRRGYRVDPTAELAGLGAANLAAGLGGGFPVSSSASRSALPATLGSHTKLVGLVAAAGLTVVIVTLRPVIAHIPDAAIAALIVAAAVAIIDVRGLLEIASLSRAELGVALATAAGVIAFDVLVGIGAALVLSVAVAFGRIARPADAVLGGADELEGWIPVESGGRPLDGLLVYRFDAPLFFANATRFRDRVLDALAANPGEERWVVLDLEGVGSIDTTAVAELATVVDDLERHGVGTVGVARASRASLTMLDRAGLLAPAGPLHPFHTINDAVHAFRSSSEAAEPHDG